MSTQYISIKDLFDMPEQELKTILVDWTKYPTNHLLISYGLLKEKQASFDDILESCDEIDRNLSDGLEGSLNKYMKNTEVSSMIEIKEKIQNGTLNQFGVKFKEPKTREIIHWLDIILGINWFFWLIGFFFVLHHIEMEDILNKYDSNNNLVVVLIILFWFLFNILFHYLRIMTKNQETLLKQLEKNIKANN